MSDPSAILSGLKQKGHRLTVARTRIIDALVKATQPFSAQEMHATLAKKGCKADKVTVYRELQFLEKEGVVQGETFQDGTKRYCATSHGHHHHLICTNCNGVQDIDMEHDLDAIEKNIRTQKSFTVQSHSLEFYGLCARCA